MPRKLSADNAPKRSSTNVRRTIGANVKARRLTLGWSQQELADRFGVSRATVSQYEIGTGEVNAGDLPRLAEILGIGLLDFYGYAPPVSAARIGNAEEKSGNNAEPNENINRLPLLRSILDLAPGDRETVRWVVQAVRGGPGGAQEGGERAPDGGDSRAPPGVFPGLGRRTAWRGLRRAAFRGIMAAAIRVV